MMPWIAGQALPEPEKDNAGRNPVVFHPDVTDLGPDMLNEELKQYVDKMVTRERNAACFVILFGLGVEDTEGIYTLRTVDCSSEGDIINMDTVVAFEEEVDALRFATLLEASLEHVPSVFPTSWGEITDWCEENNTRCRLEPGGSLLIPPESNVTMTDWERALALQRGDYKVLDEEPALGTSAVAEAESTPLAPGFFIDGPDWVYDHEDALDVSNIVDSKLADSSIASIREDLERLLNH